MPPLVLGLAPSASVCVDDLLLSPVSMADYRSIASVRVDAVLDPWNCWWGGQSHFNPVDLGQLGGGVVRDGLGFCVDGLGHQVIIVDLLHQ